MAKPVIAFYPYQRAWMADASRFKIGMMSRQIGKTFSTCGECVDDCFAGWAEDRRARWVILSRGERQAAEAMDEAIKPMTRAYYEVYNTLVKGGEPVFEETEFRAPQAKGPDAVYKALEVRFPNRSRITALPANPDTARGFSANVILDEFAFHAKSREIWAALFPVVSKGDQKLRVISTPNGKGNKFFELMTAEDSVWSRHVVDIYEAVRQGCPRDVDMLRAGIADEDAWAQEYELKWLDAASAWLDYDLISACEREEAGKPELYQGGPCFVGVDIAARNDLFVIWVVEETGGRLVTREVIAQKRITFAEQDALLDDVFRRYRVVRAGMDQTGMGEKPVEDAKRRHGAARIDGVLFSAGSKLDLATALKEKMEDREMLIPAGDPVLRADLHAISSRTGPTGIRRLVADGETDGHADRFWAAALAVGVAGGGRPDYDYQPVKGARSRWAAADDDDDDDGAGARWGHGKGAW
ncbi:Phage terminase, large subunit [Rhodovulum sp. P5]|uniref:terminase large subunit n=1 Tax=Rhodovulum phage vB_RhkS_P1 TaxID=1873452 RepID=UPI00080AB2EA|nr:terminase family protein [Rhodovulum sp. P5]YP_009285918.1 terminase large subunit [Rhodovulum phage vB_RhkS_P1]ANT39904.1 terminase large subunit [Rhodovulum phage vB_RhkS_P1]ARE38972.1 Phage terminase, large subunit [Rhodovulum sp. P5]